MGKLFEMLKEQKDLIIRMSDENKRKDNCILEYKNELNANLKKKEIIK